ncbi:cystathionine beta-lyase [Coemansia sp. RSA 922]|nr:cystathionine beta-lyase [Coemansia sp. S680]KAJ2096021.1 cystathionine beta-lyase [Coemansia sp. S100]KAJ2098240.1 cystathionine beta-lyase [Coemansia sp. RSA 922]KAJ2100279.1 cystathionine beta-lyase [Coemansia sp. S142-1]KAJ2420832.1 cystathionine beta-lyase [Coemansia sp. RSA 2531]
MAVDTTSTKSGYHLATELVHIDSDAVKDNYNAASVPIYQTATFKQNSADGSGGEYDYSRSGNPTRTAVEVHMAKIMKAERAFVVSTGMTALDVILRLVKTGQEVIAGDDIYGGTNRLLTYVSQYSGVKVHNVDTTDPLRVEEKLDPIKTRLVLLESPTNPLIKIADIRAIAARVHEVCPSALVVVDNTMMSPYLQNTLELGADIEYHSGTKYLSGHHDLMAGVIGCREQSVAESLYFVINASGSGLGPFDSWLLLRGVKTLGIRMDKQQSNAIEIADFLEAQGLKVHYPGLKSHAQYELHKSLSSGPGAVLSFETGDVGLSERIVESARLWGISVSFGCVNSLISMPCKMSHASIPAEIRKQRHLPEDLIRLCVGIEHPEDLINDLARALETAGLKVKR